MIPITAKCFKHNLPVIQIICDEDYCDKCIEEYLAEMTEGNWSPPRGTIDAYKGDHGMVWVYNGEAPIGNVHGRMPWTSFEKKEK